MKHIYLKTDKKICFSFVKIPTLILIDKNLKKCFSEEKHAKYLVSGQQNPVADQKTILRPISSSSIKMSQEFNSKLYKSSNLSYQKIKT